MVEVGGRVWVLLEIWKRLEFWNLEILWLVEEGKENKKKEKGKEMIKRRYSLGIKNRKY